MKKGLSKVHDPDDNQDEDHISPSSKVVFRVN